MQVLAASGANLASHTIETDDSQCKARQDKPENPLPTAGDSIQSLEALAAVWHPQGQSQPHQVVQRLREGEEHHDAVAPKGESPGASICRQASGRPLWP